MPVPQSVVKFRKDGVEYISSVDRVSYTMKELCKAALRDVGKYVCRNFRKAYYSHFTWRKGNIGKYTQSWVKDKYEDYPVLQVGLKPNAFYGGFQEVGSSKTPRLGLLAGSVQDNIAEIVKIESQYLSALEDEAEALALISEEDYEGSADDA